MIPEKQFRSNEICWPSTLVSTLCSLARCADLSSRIHDIGDLGVLPHEESEPEADNEEEDDEDSDADDCDIDDEAPKPSAASLFAIPPKPSGASKPSVPTGDSDTGE